MLSDFEACQKMSDLKSEIHIEFLKILIDEKK